MKGHVSKRGGSWAYWFDIDPDPLTGKRRQQTKSGYKRERDAWAACRDAISEYERGHVIDSTRRKVANALDEWLTRIEHSIKPSMAQNWRDYADYYVIPYIGQRDVLDIDGGVCDALYAKLLAEGRVKAKPKKAPVPVRHASLLPHARRGRSANRSAHPSEQDSPAKASGRTKDRRPDAGAEDGRQHAPDAPPRLGGLHEMGLGQAERR
jgi:hypothetical protein